MDMISWDTRQMCISLLLEKWIQAESLFMPTVAFLTCQFIIEVFHFSPFQTVLGTLRQLRPKLADL